MSQSHLGLSALVAAAVASDSLDGSHSRSGASSAPPRSSTQRSANDSALLTDQSHQLAQLSRQSLSYQPLPYTQPPAFQAPHYYQSYYSAPPSGHSNCARYADTDPNLLENKNSLYSGSVRHSYNYPGSVQIPSNISANGTYAHSSHASLPIQRQQGTPEVTYQPEKSLLQASCPPQYNPAAPYKLPGPFQPGVNTGPFTNNAYSFNPNHTNDSYRTGYSQYYPQPVNPSVGMPSMPSFNPATTSTRPGSLAHCPHDVNFPIIDPGRKSFAPNKSPPRPPTPPHFQKEIISLPPIYSLQDNTSCLSIPSQGGKLESINAKNSIANTTSDFGGISERSSVKKEPGVFGPTSYANEEPSSSRKRKLSAFDHQDEVSNSTASCGIVNLCTTRSSRSNSASSTASMVSNHSSHSETSVTSISSNGSSTNSATTEAANTDPNLSTVPSFGLSSLNRKKRQCSVCQGWFSNLATHKSIHLSDKSRPHTCKVCGRGFARPNDLFRHQKSHRGDAPFNCPFYKPAQIVTSTDNTTIMNSPSCHQTGGFSRCDTFKNHLKAMHFAYPLGVKKKDRNGAKGKCKHCGMNFESVEDWVTNHVETGECTKLVGRIKLEIEPCSVIINTLPEEKL